MSGVAGSAQRPPAWQDQDTAPSAIPTQRQGAAGWPRRRMRLRTRPMPLPVDLGLDVETWQAACDDCSFTTVAASKGELTHGLREHAMASSHRAPPVAASFVVPHGTRPRGAVSRLTLHIEVRPA